MGKIYTKKGDNGMTSLIGGEKVSKSDILVEVYGTIDELSAFIGVLFDLSDSSFVKSSLSIIQKDLLKIESFYASKMLSEYDIPAESILFLEEQIDRLSASHTFREFVIPGGCLAASYTHLCRTVCRRAERNITKVDVNSNCLSYMNRLSDFFFLLSEFIKSHANGESL